VLGVALTLHWSLPSYLRCSDNSIVSSISFSELRSLHLESRAAMNLGSIQGEDCAQVQVGFSPPNTLRQNPRSEDFSGSGGASPLPRSSETTTGDSCASV
jgi:hypothetical protein